MLLRFHGKSTHEGGATSQADNHHQAQYPRHHFIYLYFKYSQSRQGLKMFRIKLASGLSDACFYSHSADYTCGSIC